MAVRKAILLLLFLIGCGLAPGSGRAAISEGGCAHLVIWADLHLPSAHLDAQRRVLATVNSWDDLAGVVSLGDLCNDRGTDEEYEAVREFFAPLQKPHFPVVGNHDYIYSNLLEPSGRRIRAAPAEREAKLRKFREVFGLPRVYYDREVGPYRLLFLSADHPTGGLVELSPRQLEWLQRELADHPGQPAIVFFHAPLAGTLRDYNRNANTPPYVAQPSGPLAEILAAHPQLFLWVSGHTHTTPREQSFASGVNLWRGRVLNIHNPNMNREGIWTNSLFLCPGKVIVRTYDHDSGGWLPALERTVVPPSR